MKVYPAEGWAKQPNHNATARIDFSHVNNFYLLLLLSDGWIKTAGHLNLANQTGLITSEVFFGLMEHRKRVAGQATTAGKCFEKIVSELKMLSKQNLKIDLATSIQCRHPFCNVTGSQTSAGRDPVMYITGNVTYRNIEKGVNTD